MPRLPLRAYQEGDRPISEGRQPKAEWGWLSGELPREEGSSLNDGQRGCFLATLKAVGTEKGVDLC